MVDWIVTRYNCSYFFLKKKHYCFNCDNILIKKKHEVIVNSQSEEAKNYDFFSVDTYMHGNVKFRTFYFQCSKCGTIYQIDELVKLEKIRKKNK